MTNDAGPSLPGEGPALSGRPEPTTPPARSALPAHRQFEYELPADTGEIRRTPTGQLLAIHRPEPTSEAIDVFEETIQRRVYSMVAAILGVAGLLGSLFVGWLLPLSLAAIVFGGLGLYREEHGRAPALIGIVTGSAGLLFCGIWIVYYLNAFGTMPVW